MAQAKRQRNGGIWRNGGGIIGGEMANESESEISKWRYSARQLAKTGGNGIMSAALAAGSGS